MRIKRERKVMEKTGARERSVWKIIYVNTAWKSKGRGREGRQGGGERVGGKLRESGGQLDGNFQCW